MTDTHKHGSSGADQCHKAAPTVDEITDFEILEVAVRELAIERGLFTAEDHRRFTEWAESIGPAGGSRLVAKLWTGRNLPDSSACLHSNPKVNK